MHIPFSLLAAKTIAPTCCCHQISAEFDWLVYLVSCCLIQGLDRASNITMGGDRPVFCGNFEYDANVREIERLFERYGALDRVDMKTGEASVAVAYQSTALWATLPCSASS